jgi:hypothetical protein
MAALGGERTVELIIGRADSRLPVHKHRRNLVLQRDRHGSLEVMGVWPSVRRAPSPRPGYQALPSISMQSPAARCGVRLGTVY